MPIYHQSLIFWQMYTNMYISRVCEHAQSTILIQGILITKKKKKTPCKTFLLPESIHIM